MSLICTGLFLGVEATIDVICCNETFSIVNRPNELQFVNLNVAIKLYLIKPAVSCSR
jgi:hypothetical protein